MNCNEFDEKLSLYIDDELDGIEKKEFELHLHECEKCRSEYEELINIIKMTSDIEAEELPENYSSTLRNRLEEEKESKKVRKISRIKNVNWKVWSSVAAGLFLIVLSYGFILDYFYVNDIEDQAVEEAPQVEIHQSQDRKYYGGNDTPQVKFNSSVEGSEKTKSQRYTLTDSQSSRGNANLVITSEEAESQRKIIKDGYITLETSEFDNIYNRIVSHTKSTNGYIENSESMYSPSISASDKEPLRNGRLKIRIPERDFESTLNYFRELGEVKSQGLNERDISDAYSDTENLVKNLEIQEDRLREILKKANTVDEILRVENELRRIRTEIDRNKNTLKNWDSLVSYSTINVNIIEVKEQGEKIKLSDDEGILAKGKKGFISTINKIIELAGKTVVMAMTMAPILIPLLIVLLVLLIIIRKNIRKK